MISALSERFSIASRGAQNLRNAVGVENLLPRVPRVAALEARQPWALLRNAVGVGTRYRCIIHVCAALLCLAAGVTVAEDIPPNPIKPTPENNPLAVPKPELPRIVEADLERVAFTPGQRFPWVIKPAATKAPATKSTSGKSGAPSPGDSAVDMTSGDLVIRSFGPFTREQKVEHTATGDRQKEVVTVTKNVEIEMVQSQSVLRGDKVVIVRDMQSNITELIDARGHVEMVNPEQKGKGDMLRLEIQQVNGEIVKNEFVLVGNPTTGHKAVLWLPTQTMEAVRFVRDSVKDTFRISGTPVINMINDPKALEAADAAQGSAKKTAPKNPAKTESTSDTGGAFSLTGGNVSIESEGEMNFETATGKFKIAHNVTIVKATADPAEGVRMLADDAIITMDIPPPGAAGGANAMGGEMKILECFGRVEIRSGARTVLCDKLTMDTDRHTLYMEMTNPADKVYIFNQTTSDGGEAMIIPKWLKQNTQDQSMEGGGPMKQSSWVLPVPSLRGNGPRPEDAKPFDPRAKSKSKNTARPKSSTPTPADAPETKPAAGEGGEAVPVPAKK